MENEIKDQTAQPVIHKSRTISMVWFIPLLAMLLGGWLVYKNQQDRGVSITISFKTAAGLEAGKTTIKYKDVDLGLVENVELNKDLSGVIVTARLDKSVATYLNTNSKFWVVKPRIGAEGISGFGTLLSGANIELDASEDGEPAVNFIGLEEPPLITGAVQGTRLNLTAQEPGSLVSGSPVYYKSFKVGKIEKIQLTDDFSSVDITAFVESPYDKLINQTTNFWNVSGISADLGADGFTVQMQSVESLLIGGIAFDSTASNRDEDFIIEQTTFSLYQDAKSVGQQTYSEREFYILNFDQSIRGLNVGAPVEYRGIEIGRVVSINAQYDEQTKQVYIPVLIEIEPQRIGIQAQLSTAEQDIENFQRLIDSGFRAKLQTGSLVTGQLLVSVDFDPDAKPRAVEFFNGYPEIPTISTDLGKITQTMTQVLDKVNKLEVEKIIDNANLAIDDLRTLVNDTDSRLVGVLNNLDKTLSESRMLMKGLDEDSITRYELNTLIKEMRESARSVRTLMETIEENPNSVIFGKQTQGDR